MAATSLYGSTGANTVPSVAGAAVPFGTPINTCKMTRSELQKLLDQSGYGANQAMFNCYFHPGNPPTCLNCNQPVAEHGDGQHNVCENAGLLGAALLGGGAAVAIDPNALPRNVSRTTNMDTYQTKGVRVVLCLIIFFVVLGGGMIALFAGVGMFKHTVVPIIGPAIILSMGLLLTLAVRTQTMTFDKSTKTWEYDKRNLLCRCCCHTHHTGGFSQLGAVTAEPSNVMINNMPQMSLKMSLPGTGEQLSLGLYSMLIAPTEAAVWNQYINNLKNGSGGSKLDGVY